MCPNHGRVVHFEGPIKIKQNAWSVDNFYISGSLKCATVVKIKIPSMKKNNSPMVLAHFRLSRPSGAPLGPPGRASGIFWATWACLWGLWGPPGGVSKASMRPFFQKYGHLTYKLTYLFTYLLSYLLTDVLTY